MAEKLGWQIAEEAWAAFAAWLEGQPPEVHEMEFHQQAALYAAAQH